MIFKALICSLLPICATASERAALGDAFYDAGAFSLAAQEYHAALLDPDGRQSAWPAIRLGQSYQALGDPARAADAYRDFLDHHPAGLLAPQAWMGLGLSLQSAGRTEEAKQALQQVLASYPLHPAAAQAAFGLAENLYREGHYADAEEAYRRIAEKHPHFPHPEYIVYARAWCFFELGDMRHASELFKALQRDWPASDLAPYSMYQVAEAEFASGNYVAAAGLYQEFETRYPEHVLVPAARYSTAWCLFQRARWREAFGSFQRFAAMHAGHELAPWASYMAGLSLTRAEDLDLAATAYQAVVQKYPGSEPAQKSQYGLVWLTVMRRDFSATVAASTDLLKAYPDSSLAASAMFLRADAQGKLERFASARADYLALAKRYPDSALAPDMPFFVAGTYLAEGDAAKALGIYAAFRRDRGPTSAYADDARLREADAQFNLGRLDEAEKAYAGLVRENKKAQIPGARYGLAWIAFQQKRWNESKDQWRRLADDYPAHPLAVESLLHAGDSAYNLNRYEDARAFYKRAAAGAAGSSLEIDARYQAGWASYRLKDFDAAHADWQFVAGKTSDPGRAADARYWMAWATFRKGQFSEAADAFADVAKRYPKSGLALESQLRQADSLYNAKSYEAAIALYQGVVARAPEDARAAAALHGIQWCYYALGRDEEAVAASKAFLEKYKHAQFAPAIQYRIAEHYLNRGNFQQAEKELDALESGYPENGMDLNAIYWRGQARFKNLKFSQAIQDWTRVLDKAPSHPLAPRASFKIGMAYYRMQEYPEALSAFEKTLDAYGNTPDVAADALFNRGMTYKRMQRDKDALETYASVLAKFPQSPLANMSRIRIGYIHEDAGAYDLAISAYRDLAAHDSGKLGAEAQFLVGDCLVAQKKMPQALAAYQELVDRFKGEGSWTVTALAKIGELEEQAGHDAKALQAYEKIVQMGSNPSWTEAARKRMELIKARIKAAKHQGTAP